MAGSVSERREFGWRDPRSVWACVDAVLQQNLELEKLCLVPPESWDRWEEEV